MQAAEYMSSCSRDGMYGLIDFMDQALSSILIIVADLLWADW